MFVNFTFIENLIKLEELDISCVYFPNNIKLPVSLKKLICNYCKLNNIKYLKYLKTLTNLKELDIAFNKFKNKIKIPDQLVNLEKLYINGNIKLKEKSKLLKYNIYIYK